MNAAAPTSVLGGRGARAVLGAFLHLGLIAAPVVLAGRARSAIADGPILLYLLLSTAMVAGEILAQRSDDLAAAPGAQGGDGTSRDRALALMTGLTLLAIGWSALLERSTALSAAPAGFAALAGALLIAIGVALRCASIKTLGAFFITEARVAPGQPLVTSGVYRLLRHPSEAGLLAIGLGVALLLQSRAALFLWALSLVPTSIARVRREDRVLSRAFGEAYQRYAARAPSLLPGLSLLRLARPRRLPR